jgi:hypothetical protein
MKNRKEIDLDENQASFGWGDLILILLLIGMLFSIIFGAVFRFILLFTGVTALLKKGQLFVNPQRAQQ